MHIIKEITPLTALDCFTIFSRSKQEFDFPLHCHEELELNFILNAKGAKRIVGDHSEEIGAMELVLVGSNVPHVWETHKCTSGEIREITIQFHKDLLDDKFLRRNQLRFIREMFEKSSHGILFSEETMEQLKPRLLSLYSKQNFDSVLELMSILHDLSISRNIRLLSNNNFNNPAFVYNSRRIEKVMTYINANFDRPVLLADAAKLANMAEVSFSRFFKARTGVSFIDCLIEIRISNASRLLIDSNLSISEIAYNCGFNNISNFNRTFKKKKNLTPVEFRQSHRTENRIFI